MTEASENCWCEKAKRFYYAALYGEVKKDIPADILEHLRECQRCQDALVYLKEGIDTIELWGRHVIEVVTENARGHFEHLNEWVTCSQVKRFLPNLAHPEYRVTIATPIITHMDHCYPCNENLKTIKSLELESRQLDRLAKLFADKTLPVPSDCSEAKKAFPVVATLKLEDIPRPILQHLYRCSICNNELYQLREIIYKSLQKYPSVAPANQEAESEDFCDVVSPCDIFDFVLPYEVNPTEDEYSEHRLEYLNHYRICTKCLEKMLELHKTIYSIFNRIDSSVATWFHVGSEDTIPTDCLGDDIQHIDGNSWVIVRYGDEPAKQENPKVSDDNGANQNSTPKYTVRKASIIPIAPEVIAENPNNIEMEDTPSENN